MNSLEKMLGQVFVDWLPGLPTNIKDWVVKILPWVLIILGALGLVGWLGVLGLLPLSLKHLTLGQTFAAVLFHLLVPILQVLTIAGGYFMLQRRRRGWALAFYALLLSFIVNLTWFNLAGIVFNLIFAYLLFQVKPYYQ